MHLFASFVAGITLLIYLFAGLEFTLNRRKIERLDRVPPIGDAEAPRISVIVPACNEERNIEEALASVLAQDYPDFEVIAVDDRSTDSTGTILNRMAVCGLRLRVIHLRRLPAGWLGKNNALQQGAAHANGRLLLFTDADVVFERSVLRRAAAYFENHALDHLAIPPRAIVHGFLSNAFVAVFALLFGMHTKPWKVRDPKAREHIGIGAFNMVRASAYWKAGGHAPIAMRPDDDMKLGKLLKLCGYRSDMVIGTRLLSVEWYASFAEMRRGLMKNLFAGVDYQVSLVILFSLLQLVFLVWPFVGLFVGRGAVQALNAAIVLALCITFIVNARAVGISWWWCLSLPLGALISVYLLVRAATLTLKNGGIEWRGTKYPLAQLRANRL
ncbi:MAG: glycosyltransferase [Acidobacteriota bacterium]|nr:glycosyltransferase [Acidobacteriota bacterium]